LTNSSSKYSQSIGCSGKCIWFTWSRFSIRFFGVLVLPIVCTIIVQLNS
jgi:hypothetical protein